MRPQAARARGNESPARWAVLVLLLVVGGPLLAGPSAAADGDWVVYGTEVLQNTTRVQGGSVVVMAGGELTVRNATLEFNLTQEGGAAIQVNEGATLRLENCTVRSTTAGYHFNFLVAGRLEIHGCDISDVRGDVGLGGIEITGGDVLIEDSTIHDSKYYGLFVRSGSPVVRRTTFETQPVAISVLPGATPRIEDVTIRNATTIGLKIADATPVVRNLTVLQSGNFAVGAIGSTLDIDGCKFSGGLVGIDVVGDTQGRVEHCQFLDLGTGVRAQDSPVAVGNSTFVSVSVGVNSTRSAVEVSGSSFAAFNVGVKAEGAATSVYGGSATGNDFCGAGVAFEVQTPSFFVGDNTFCPDVTSLRTLHWVMLEVRAPDGSPAAGASITMTTADGDEVFTGITDPDGKVTALLEEYRIDPGGARHNLTPHGVRITYRGQVTVTSMNSTAGAAVQITLAPVDPPPVGVGREGLLLLGVIFALAAAVSGAVVWRAAKRRRERAEAESRPRSRRGPRSGR